MIARRGVREKVDDVARGAPRVPPQEAGAFVDELRNAQARVRGPQCDEAVAAEGEPRRLAGRGTR